MIDIISHICKHISPTVDAVAMILSIGIIVYYSILIVQVIRQDKE